jgi:hypothetical protein
VEDGVIVIWLPWAHHQSREDDTRCLESGRPANADSIRKMRLMSAKVWLE